MTPAEDPVPTEKEELSATILADIEKTKEMAGKAARQTAATILLVAPVCWYTIDLVGTHWPNLDAIAYLYSVVGFISVMLVAPLASRRLIGILLEGVPEWMGQHWIPKLLAFSAVLYGSFATVIGLVGEWRPLTMPLFFVCYFFCVTCIVGYVGTKTGKKALDWRSLLKEVRRTGPRSMKSVILDVIAYAGLIMALGDIFVMREELLTLVNIEGMLLLLALMFLSMWLMISASSVIALVLYRYEAERIHTSMAVELGDHAPKASCAYSELRRNGSVERKEEI